MPVYLRKRVGKKKTRFYLDIYHNGLRHYEFLDLYHMPAKNPFEAEMNRQNKEIAEQIRAKRQLELESSNFDIEPKHKKQLYFMDYYESWLQRYSNKDKRLAKASFVYFQRFIEEEGMNKKLVTSQITKEIAKRFKEFLDSKLNGETPYNYFNKFIKLCNDATEQRVFKANPCLGVRNSRKEGLKKEILTIEEIISLKDAECPNSQVKDAFLFCLNTGLRWVDVKALRWHHISGEILKMNQSKTEKEVIIYLNNGALQLLPDREKRDDLVFSLPSHTGALKSLQVWVDKSGIDKHITWHSARHSFAVNLLINKVDIKTMSSLLGHAGLKHTEKYTRVVDELKKQAVKTINLNF